MIVVWYISIHSIEIKICQHVHSNFRCLPIKKIAALQKKKKKYTLPPLTRMSVRKRSGFEMFLLMLCLAVLYNNIIIHLNPLLLL